MSGLSKAIGKILGVAFVVGSFFGGRAIGSALGFYGWTGFAIGASVIAAGLLAATAVCVGAYYAVQGCMSLYNRYQHRSHYRPEAPVQPSFGNTAQFGREFMAQPDASNNFAPSAPPAHEVGEYYLPPAPPQYQQPQGQAFMPQPSPYDFSNTPTQYGL